MEEKIKHILMNELCWVFCDTCEREGTGECGDCNKKLLQELNWGLSEEAAEELAKDILEIME